MVPRGASLTDLRERERAHADAQRAANDRDAGAGYLRRGLATSLPRGAAARRTARGPMRTVAARLRHGCGRQRRGGSPVGPRRKFGARAGKKRKPRKTLSLCEASFYSVGATGFEPATSCSRSRRSTGLSYAPKLHESPSRHDPSHAPERTRTSNLLIRSQMLYPIELRAPTSAQKHQPARFLNSTGR